MRTTPSRFRLKHASILVSILLCISQGLPLRAQAKKPNIVLLVLDQLRADQLHCYGNARPTSPNIDKLASHGALFTRFNTVTPWTSPCFGSLHTSLYPSRHGVTLFWKSSAMPLLNKDNPTLAENLQKAGYHTAAFVDNSLAGYPLTGSGFDEYYEESTRAVDITRRDNSGANTEYGDPYTTAHVLRWLKAISSDSKPFFLYVHFLEPHSPYDPPPQDDLFKFDAYPYLTNTGYDLVRGGLLRMAMMGDQKAIARLYQLYDGNIHLADRYVGQILDQLHALGLDEDTYILLTSDHGELLYSHPADFLTFDHRSLYDTALHIPLIVSGPGIPQGETIDALGSNIDTAPTILALAGAPPLSDAEGKSLLPLIHGQVSSINNYLFAEEDVEIPERSVRNNRYKLIRNLWDGDEQLFDMQEDPAELIDVANQHPEAVKELHNQLDAWMQTNEPSVAVQQRRWMIYTQPQKVVTVDDITTGGNFLISHRQSWHPDDRPESGDFDGACFWTEGGDGTRTAIWRGDNPLVGKYKVLVYFGHPDVGKLATNAIFKIVTAHSTKRVNVNFQRGAGQWNLLGVFDDPRFVELNNAANGIVIADAVRFERADE
jgi:arylsulfatase A-like enzyme